MIVIVDERQLVIEGYSALFAREGVPVTSVQPQNFLSFIDGISDSDFVMIEAFMLGQCNERRDYPKIIKNRYDVPVLCISEVNSLEQTLDLFQVGADDVLKKPIHAREILARIDAIKRRSNGKLRKEGSGITIGELRVFNDGRDPQIRNKDFPLPRRERRILEYLISNYGRRVNKTQIFNAVYGIFDTEVEESVIESHISKLRKKLKQHFGYDIIDSKRYLGYRLVLKNLLD